MPSIYTAEMAKRLIDIDDDALEAAQAALGTRTMRDTVNEALRLAGRHELARFGEGVESLGGIEFGDRADAWRRA